MTSVDLELSLLIDASGSVSSSEYELQIGGYADAFDDASLYENIISQGLDQKIAVNFILWSGSNQQQEVVGWTLIDSVSASQNFAQTIRETLLPEFGGSRPFSGGTNSESAINFADDLFFSNDFEGRRKAIEVSGDGAGGSSATQAARDAALAKGINVINGIVIGTSSSVTNFYQNSLIGGTNADGTPAFVGNASTFQEFGAVVRDVLVRELTPSAFFSVSDASLQEGDSNTTQLTFTVTLSKASTQTTSVDFATVDGSAIAGKDFTATIGTLTFAPGETSKTVTVDVTDDNRLEVEETFSLVLSNAVNANLRDIPGIGTITDNDSLRLSSTAIDEGSAAGTFVGELAATDATDTDPFTFSLLADGDGRFALSGNQIQVVDGSRLDFETNSSHDITVQAQDAAGNTFERAFTIQVNDVTDGAAGNLEVIISAPRRIAANGTDEVTVTYRNTGDTEIAAPLLNLEASGALFRSGTETEFSDSQVQFLGINNKGTPGVLPPGASNTFNVEFKPDGTNSNRINFTVSAIDEDAVINWESLRETSRPNFIPSEAWGEIYNNFVAEVGTTAGEYQQLLIKNANYLSEIGEYEPYVDNLLAFEFQQASDFQGISQRYSLGSLGRGRTFIGDVELSKDEAGNVSIINSGTSRSFKLLKNGTYQGQTADSTTINFDNVTNRYTLTEKDGTFTVFNSDGKIDFIEDTNGNRITANYTNGQLTNLTDSFGNSLTFEHNNNGRIVSVTDADGRITNYGYDTSGELLETVTDEAGTTTYTYNDRAELTSITDPNGTKIDFSYDAKGRLEQQSITSTAANAVKTEVINYSYGESAELTVNDGSGNETKLLLNENGQVGQLTDANGRLINFNYDNQGKLIQIIAPQNNSTLFGYDNHGNLTSQIDASGNITTFTYDPKFNQLASFTDPRGNGITYDYDESGNLEAIEYPDGSKESFAYNANGDVTVSVNRRGQEILYSYNNRGQITSQVNPDADTPITYTYDARGNLDTVTYSLGTIDLDYDGSDRLTKITYPGGRFLEYTYDAGDRRTTMTDHNGNRVNYGYDDAGRLAKLTDGNGNLIVSYEYDAVGRLAREDKGNGTYTTYTYDPTEQLTSLVNYAQDNSINSRFDYSYDELGQQIGVSTLDGEWTYSYDAVGQLTNAIFASTNPEIPDQNLSYVYDAAGNRIRTVINGETTQYNANNLNQYETAGDIVYDYDADGNLISKTEGNEVTTYQYNSENRLVRVVEPDGVETEYEYDALGNRIATVYDGERIEYLIDAFGLGNVISEYDSEGNLVANYTHGLGLESRIDNSSATAYYDFDAVGSTISLTNASGQILNQYTYSPFGQEIQETEAITNPFEFVGEFGIMEDPNGLDFMRARYYDSEQGRFTSPDPIGLAAGDTNLYRYTFNNPVNYIDPSGEIVPLIVAGFLVGGTLNAGVSAGYAAYRGEDLTVRQIAGDFVAGGIAGAVGAISGPIGGTIVKSLGGYATRLGAKAVTGSVSAIGGAIGQLVDNVLFDPENASISSVLNAAVASGVLGFGASFIPVSGFSTIRQANRFAPGRTGKIGSLFATPNARRLFAAVTGSAGLSAAANFIPSYSLEPLTSLIDDAFEEIANAATNIFDLLSRIPFASSNQARSKGEPHLTTFDGVGYDFQGAGEFTLVESLNGDLNIQVRYVQIDNNVTVASAVATEVDGQNVVIDSQGIEFIPDSNNPNNLIPQVTRSVSGGEAKVTIDGVEVDITSGGSIEVGNSRIYRSRGDEYTIVYAGEDGVLNDGDDQLVVNYFRPGTINTVDVYLGDEKKGQIVGLLGNLNGNRDDDIALRDGTILPRPLEFNRLYGDYRDDYRITDISKSLFTYELGQNPNTFYNPNFPKAPFSYKDLSSELKAKGDAAALKAGYTPGTFEFESAAFDFAVTSDPGFLEGRETDPEVSVPLTVVNTVNQPLTITSNPNFSVAENTARVGAIAVSNPNSNNLIFSISDGIDQALFSINSNSGELTFINTPDFEAAADVDGNNNYQLQVTVSNGSETVTQDLTVTVTNVNEAPTIDDAIFTVDENSNKETQVGIITVTDPENEALNLAIASGNLDPDNDNNLAFAINPLTGAIIVNDSDDLDFETNPSFNLEVTATDAGGLSSTANIAINLIDKPDKPVTQIDISQSENGILILNGGDSSNLKFTLNNNNTRNVNEIGVFVVDDNNGNINGIAPGTAGYTEAALDKAQVIFSAITNIPNGFETNNLTQLLEFNSGDRLRFYLVKNSSTDAVRAGATPITDVLFSDPSSQKITDLGTGEFSVAWKDGSGNNTDFQDLVVKVQPTNDSLPLGTNLQGKYQGEVIDLRGVTSQVKADFTVHREAAYNNFIGFYQVADENGGIDINSDGNADILTGQAGYIEAAIRNRVAGIDLTVNNQGTATYTGTFQPGYIFAPFIIANGRPDALLDSNSNNDPAVYFPFLGANTDQKDHIRLLGNNIFGFEDLANGGDNDFNDVIVRVNLSVT